MNGDDAADRLTKANRVSIRAVLVPHGKDPTKALVDAGILDPVAIPFTYADDSFGSGRAMSDGRTPNVTATLELDKAGSSATPEMPQGASSPPRDTDWAEAPPPPRALGPPAAFGSKPLAPVRKPPG
jgi:hypothetical protein